MKTIYTCLTDNYDNIQEQLKYPGWHYVAYVDEPFESDTWDCRPIEFDHPDPTRRSRYHKIAAPPEGISLYMDARMVLTENPDRYIKPGLGLRVHPYRNCVFDEAEEILKLKLDTEENVRKAMALYRDFPKQAGLNENGLIARRGDYPLLNMLWWQMYMLTSVRDQLTLKYCLWQLNISPYIIPRTVVKSIPRASPRRTV